MHACSGLSSEIQHPPTTNFDSSGSLSGIPQSIFLSDPLVLHFGQSITANTENFISESYLLALTFPTKASAKALDTLIGPGAI